MFIANPPECLNNFIVVKDGCYCDEFGAKIPTPIPTSGFYIESLEGITIENLSDITNEANRTATNLVNQKVFFAAKIVEKQLLHLLASGGFDLNKQGADFEYCSTSGNYSQIGIGVEKGIRVSRAGLSSKQARIYVRQIRLKSKNTATTTVKIEDISGNVLWSTSVSAVADKTIYIQVDQRFDPEIIFILADASTVQLYEWSCNSLTGCCGHAVGHKDLAVMGFDGLQNSFTGYLGACLRLECTDEDIICQFAKRLAMAILYQTGVEILKEWLSPSSRLNFIKINGQDWAAAKIEEWENMSLDLIKVELQNIARMLQNDRVCYKCTNSLKSFAKLPS